MVEKLRQVRSPTLPLEVTLKRPLFTSHTRGYVGLILGEAKFSDLSLWGKPSEVGLSANLAKEAPCGTRSCLFS